MAVLVAEVTSALPGPLPELGPALDPLPELPELPWLLPEFPEPPGPPVCPASRFPEPGLAGDVTVPLSAVAGVCVAAVGADVEPSGLAGMIPMVSSTVAGAAVDSGAAVGSEVVVVGAARCV